MTDRESIETFKKQIILAERKGYTDEIAEYIKAMKRAIIALKKQEPKILRQPDPLDKNIFRLRCPHCRTQVGIWNKRIKVLNKFEPYMKFCQICGQAIDWEVGTAEEE